MWREKICLEEKCGEIFQIEIFLHMVNVKKDLFSPASPNSRLNHRSNSKMWLKQSWIHIKTRCMTWMPQLVQHHLLYSLHLLHHHHCQVEVHLILLLHLIIITNIIIIANIIIIIIRLERALMGFTVHLSSSSSKYSYSWSNPKNRVGLLEMLTRRESDEEFKKVARP